jgi:hypothetical protein
MIIVLTKDDMKILELKLGDIINVEVEKVRDENNGKVCKLRK